MDSIDFVVFGIFYLIMWGIAFLATLGESEGMFELYAPKDKRKRKEHKIRMKYLTSLPREETILRLMQMYMPLDGSFKKENDNEKDQMYMLEITEIPSGYRNMFRGSVKYRVMVTPAQEGSAVWVFLLALDRHWMGKTDLVPIDRLGDDEMLNMFAWEIEKLFEKLLNAVRVE